MGMLSAQAGRIVAISAMTGAITFAGLGGGTAMAAAPRVSALPCSASMSIVHPRDYTTTDVRVHSAAGARVTTVAHYRTTRTTHHATTGPRGNATVPYYISRATPGFTVHVSVSVVAGNRSGSCSTSFTPHA